MLWASFTHVKQEAYMCVLGTPGSSQDMDGPFPTKHHLWAPV